MPGLSDRRRFILSECVAQRQYLIGRNGQNTSQGMKGSKAVKASLFAEKHAFVALGVIRFLCHVAADTLLFSRAARMAFRYAQIPPFRSLLGGWQEVSSDAQNACEEWNLASFKPAKDIFAR